MPLKDLANKTPRTAQLEHRYPREKLELFDRELRELVDLVNETNGVMPSLRSISNYLRDEHDISVVHTTVQIHLDRIKRGEEWHVLKTS